MAELDPNVDWKFIGDLVNQIRTIYPNMAWMLDIPELSGTIIKAGLEQWDEGRIVAAIQATEWWKARNEAARQWEQLSKTDPATAQQNIAARATQMLQWARSNGFELSDDEAAYIAGVSLSKGQTVAEWQAGIADFVMGRSGARGPVADNLDALAAEYAVPLSDQTLREWQKAMMTGMADEQTFRSYLQEQAKSLFPSLAGAIDRGITVRQYVAPYQEIAVRELGVNPAEIDWRDPKWSAAIHKVDPQTGNPVSMSLSEWTKELRTNSVYGFDLTQRGQEQATLLSNALLERFGRAA